MNIHKKLQELFLEYPLDKNQIKSLIKEGADINFPVYYHNVWYMNGMVSYRVTTLMKLIINNETDIEYFQFAIEMGADSGIICENNSVLNWWVENYYTDEEINILQILLENGASKFVNTFKDGFGILDHISCKFADDLYLKTVDLILSMGYNVDYEYKGCSLRKRCSGNVLDDNKMVSSIIRNRNPLFCEKIMKSK